MERVLQFLPYGSGYHWCVPPLRGGLPLDALLRRIGLLERGAYAERTYGRWSVHCSFLPDGSGYHWMLSSPAGRVADGVLLVGGAGCRCAEEAGERAF